MVGGNWCHAGLSRISTIGIALHRIIRNISWPNHFNELRSRSIQPNYQIRSSRSVDPLKIQLELELDGSTTTNTICCYLISTYLLVPR